jgi:phytoene synthase
MINIELENYKNPTKQEINKINSARNALLNLANKYYQSGEKGIAHLPPRTARAVLVASKLYQNIGIKILNRKVSYESYRVYLNVFEKLLITIKLIFKLNKKKNIDNHNEMLHSSLIKLPDVHIK